MKRIVVVGCGGIGGIVAAKLVGAGYDVTAVTHNPAIAQTISERGLTAVWDDTFHTVSLSALATLAGEAPQPFDMAILAVPPTAAEDAVVHILPHLLEDAPVVCCPNGLIEERLSATLGVERVVGGVVSFGATMDGPGKVQQTSAGGFTLGVLPGGSEALMDAVTSVLEHVGPVQRTDNLRGARWSKLAINCAISSLGTIAGERLGTIMRYRYVRRLALETMTEVVDVARAEGVELKKVAGTLDLNWLALSPSQRLAQLGSPGLVARHTVLLAVGAKFRRMRSSMLRAIERGREPSVDFLNGEVCEHGEKHGISTPINAALTETVHAIARGEKTSSVDLLKALYQETREDVRAAVAA